MMHSSESHLKAQHRIIVRSATNSHWTSSTNEMLNVILFFTYNVSSQSIHRKHSNLRSPGESPFNCQVNKSMPCPTRCLTKQSKWYLELARHYSSLTVDFYVHLGILQNLFFSCRWEILSVRTSSGMLFWKGFATTRWVEIRWSWSLHLCLQRLDCRTIDETRPLKIEFRSHPGHVSVTLGSTQ